MKLRILAVVVLALAAIAAQAATPASKQTAAVKTAAKTTAVAAQAQLVPMTLNAIFAAAAAGVDQEVTDARGMSSIKAPNTEVVMVRINADGTRERACVNTEAAAAAFVAGEVAADAPKTKKE